MRSFGIDFGRNIFGTFFEGTAFDTFFGIASGTNFFEGTAFDTFFEGAAFDANPAVDIFASRPRDGAAAGGGREGGDEPWAGPCTAWP